MLYKDTVEAETLNLMLRMMKDETLREFDLGGDTALSLQIGHTPSAGIDLLSSNRFDSVLLSKHLSGEYQAENIRTLKNGLFSFIGDVKVDLLSSRYPVVEIFKPVEGIRMSSPEDIGALKLNAIVEDGSRFKDFIDVYKLLEHRSLEELIDAYEKKYPNAHRSRMLAGLIDDSRLVPASLNFIGQEITVKDVAYRFKKAVQEPKRIFESVPWRPRTFKKSKGHAGQSPDKSRGKGLRR